MVEHVKRLKRELVYKGAILDIYKDTMELPDGNKAEWDFVSHRMGAAAILPVMKDGRIVMVRQYRNALERETLEIPAGCRDSKTEDTAYCAAREMEEETGYRSTNVKHLLSLRTTVAFCDEAVDIFVATDLEVGTRHLDEAESIDVEIYTLAFVGRGPGKYNIWMGGSRRGDRLGFVYQESVSVKEIVDVLRPVFARFAAERNQGEGFGDWSIRSLHPQSL